MKRFFRQISVVAVLLLGLQYVHAGRTFVHPGISYTQADIDRMRSLMHSRGCGERISDFRSYAIESGMDSLLFVENLLLTEMALETGYEGSRFADILRIGRHRNSAAFVAATIARRNSSLETLLQDETKWYLPRSYSGKR